MYNNEMGECLMLPVKSGQHYLNISSQWQSASIFF